MTLRHYKQEASLAESASLVTAGDMLKSLNVASAVESVGCVHHGGVENGDCADTHISDWLSICPRSLRVSFGQLKEGLCSDVSSCGVDGGCSTLWEASSRGPKGRSASWVQMRTGSPWT